ncbi:MAG: DUF4388 domain-containing protein [Thermoanaerobaculia bacterium]
MALEGTLKDFSLADIFQLIGLQRKTGVLTLRGKDDTVTVTFLDGKVVAADSLNKRLENRLGNVLVKTGTLAPEQLSHALDIQRETLQRLGFILTHYQIISQEALRSALQLQILQIVYRLFRWKDGEYHFSQETTIEYDRENVIPITAESILMEGARMIDEWPIIEKRIRSYDMIFRKKLIDQEIVVVGHDEADEVSFDDGPGHRRKKSARSEKIRITPEEKSVYDAVDGTVTVAEIVETSRFAEFDTVKAMYELLTRDLIEEVRGRGAVAAVETETAPPVEAAEIPPVPLPLVILLTAIAIALLLTSIKNPFSGLQPLGDAPSPLLAEQKAISLQRIDRLGDGMQAYMLAHGKAPDTLTGLAPHFVGRNILTDPWGNEYKLITKDAPAKSIIIGFSPDGKPDTDLFLTHAMQTVPTGVIDRPPSGGIILVD